ncbi:aminotransferase class V-fold PLP-dependent enzyme [bacterium]|nr:aminotransferase class V-fold PLP-dependent enzyme [bacterium]
MIPISSPYIGEEEKAAVMEVLSSGQLAQGPKVAAFEEAFAAWSGARYAVATTSGTTALHVALLAHGIGPGDEVITSSFSFIASANCVLYVGATPVFADIEPAYFTLDPEDVARKITPRTKAIIPVHLFGQPCNMDELTELASEHNLAIIEDACQAHGARWNGQMVGSFGTTCYSFYPTKNMMSGEGGMITTDDAAVAEQARLIRQHGMAKRYVHEMLGFNLRLSDLHAAIGLVQLKRVDGWNAQRQANAAYLSEHLADVPGVVIPAVRDGAEHVFHQYTVRVQDRDDAVKAMSEQGIGVGIYYPTAIHQQPLYKNLGYDLSLPETERASREVMSLPVHPFVGEAELSQVTAAVKNLQPAAVLV